VATFTDADPNATAASFTATIAWGDGTTSQGTVTGTGTFSVLGTHTYTNVGTFSVTVTILDVGGSSATVTDTATVTGEVSAQSAAFTATEAAALSNVTVATFTGLASTTYTATIDWGDGHISAGTVSGSSTSYTVKGSSTYGEDGFFPVTVTILKNGTTMAVVSSPVAVADAALAGTGVSLNPTQGTLLNAVPVARFSDPNLNAALSDYGASIDWGDGNSSAGTISYESSGSFVVTGSDTYAQAGSYTITITITDVGGSSITITDPVTVAAAAPVVSGIGPSWGPTSGGTAVTITGNNLSGATAVTFGSTAATLFTVNADGSLSAVAPAESAGTVDVQVTTAAGTSATSSADQFTSLAAAPTVTGVSPSSGPTGGGTTVTITGTNLADVNQVYFGTIAATSFTITSPTTISATAPAELASTVDVTVSSPYGPSPTSSADQYTFTGTAPTVTALDVTAGPAAGGSLLTITGTNLNTATQVSFGTTTTTAFSVLSGSELLVTAPAHAAGTADVTVTTAYGTSSTSSADQYTFVAAPAVSGLSSSSGATGGGNAITVSGSGFTGAFQVSFGSTSATSFTVNSDSSISATVPPSSAGMVDVTVITQSGGGSAPVSADQYTFVATAPSVSAVSPNRGPTAGGTTVTITGSNFNGATQVTFGGTSAASFTVVSATQITATAPAEAAATVDLVVTSPYGSSSTSSADQYTFADAAAPTVTGLSVSSGPLAGGTAVVLTGTGFTAATAVTFGGTPAASFTVNSSTQITATSPGQTGTVDVSVTTPYGTSSTGTFDHFTYQAALPSVTAVSPGSGTSAGGTSVTITGSNFTGVTRVMFGTLPAASFTFNSDGSLTATSPVQATGTYDITVVTPYGVSATSSADHYTVSAACGLPTVTGRSPTSGPTGGGTSTTITGTNFTGATAIYFGTALATSFTVNSATSLTAVSPAATSGTVDLRVVTAAGMSSTATADHFTYNATAPSVSGVSPSSGVATGGTVVTVSGSNFNGATAVKFGTTVATSFVVNSATSITATAPALTAGSYNITVTTPYGTSSTSPPDLFSALSAPLPALVYTSAASGPVAGGTSVVLTGVGFTGASQVRFGSVPATSYTVNSDTQLTVTAPAQAAGTVDITVTTASGTSAVVTNDQFTYTESAPAITGVSPSSGTTGGGQAVTISGSKFTGATAVYFGSTPATLFQFKSDSSITAVAPAAVAGTVDVSIVTAVGQSATVSADHFTYNASSATPTVTGVSPGSGPLDGGNSITVTGTNLAGTSQVFFGTVAAASFTVNSATSLTAVAPAGAAGTVDISILGPGGISSATSADHYTYTAVAPTVTGVSPATDTTAGGTLITVSGTNFIGASAVTFGSTPCTSFNVTSASSLVAVVPIGAAGTVDITVTTSSGTSAVTSADHFAYTSTANTPTVTGLSTGSGPTGGGTVVTLTGTNFTGATAVAFGSTAATTFTVNSGTSITATAPAESAATVDVTVTTAYGVSSAVTADHFTYNATAPSVSSVSPTSGPTAGGTLVTVSGSNLNGTTAVTFGGTAATSFTVVSATQVTATTAAGSAGTIDTVLTTPYGTSGTSAADQFTFVAAPTVGSLSVSSGTTAGGTSVVLTGTNFTGLVSVSFGTVPAAAITINSATQLTVTSPASAPGPVDVTVTTGNDTSALSSADQFTFVAPVPSVTSIGTSLGSTAGGTSVAITGSGFTGATQVSFGGVAATSFTVNSDTSITATSPAASGISTVDVSVTTLYGGTSAGVTADQFTYLADPIRLNSGFQTNILAATDNGSTGSITLPFSVNFYGNTYSSLWVNNNGNVTFDAAMSNYTPVPMLTTIRSIIAPFFADVDTRVGAVVTYGTDTVNGHSAFGVNWINVGYNAQHVDKTNIFQLVLISRSDVATGAFDVEFNYGRIAWEGSDATGASGGYGGTPPQSGYSNGSGGSGTNYQLGPRASLDDDTGVPGALLDGNPVTGLIWGSLNSGVTGRYLFAIRSGGGQAPTQGGGRPTVTGVLPAVGPDTGGTAVTLAGTGFSNVVSVFFGLTAASSFQVVSSTTIVATSPAHAVGSVDVRVVTGTANSAATSSDRFTFAQPQRAASVPAVTAAGGAVLTPSSLQPVVNEAILLWTGLGLNVQQQHALENFQVEVATLPAGYLGLTAGATVWLDPNADGYGWFIDATPADNQEFPVLPGDVYVATAGSRAAGRIDLLTVLAHELGHLLGLPSIEQPRRAGDVMTETLPPGVRRLPGPENLNFTASIAPDGRRPSAGVAVLPARSVEVRAPLPSEARSGAVPLGGPGVAEVLLALFAEGSGILEMPAAPLVSDANASDPRRLRAEPLAVALSGETALGLQRLAPADGSIPALRPRPFSPTDAWSWEGGIGSPLDASSLDAVFAGSLGS
jgi:hypothetical protein